MILNKIQSAAVLANHFRENASVVLRLMRLSHSCAATPRPPAPVFDFRAHFSHSAPMETHAFGFTLRRAKSDFLSVNGLLWPRTLGIPSPARRKELLVRDGVEAVLTRYAKET